MQTVYAVIYSESTTDGETAGSRILGLCTDEVLANRLASRRGWYGSDCAVKELTLFSSEEELNAAGFTLKEPNVTTQ
jgi:hypothetical protein